MSTTWLKATMVAGALALAAGPALADVVPGTDDLAMRAGGGTFVGYDGRPEHGGETGAVERVVTERPIDNGTGSGTTWVSHAANPWAGPRAEKAQPAKVGR